MVRADTAKTGLQVKHKVKIGLYADDVCYLRNPLVSLRVLSQLNGEFGPVSACKLNQGNSVISGFHIGEQLRKKILIIMSGK